MDSGRPAVRLACVGDVMCGDSFYAMGHGVAAMIDDAGRSFMPAPTSSFLRAHDLVLANVEAPLSDRGRRRHSLRSRHMRGRASSASLLAEWGVTTATLANNHILEHGVEVAADTAANLRQAGITPLGTGIDDGFDNTVTVSRCEVNGLPLSFIGVCTLEERYAHRGYTDWAEVTDAAADERAAGRVVVVTVHWGQEFVDRPNRDQIDRARLLAAAGVAVVAGHHPHVAQGVAEIGSTVVAFSLGNFVFNGFVPDTRWSYALSIDLGPGGVEAWTTVPVAAASDHRPILDTGRGPSRPEVVRNRTELQRRHRVAAAAVDAVAVGGDAGSVSTAVTDGRYQAEARRLTEESRVLLRRRLLQGVLHYPPVMVPQILWRPVVKRLGRW